MDPVNDLSYPAPVAAADCNLSGDPFTTFNGGPLRFTTVGVLETGDTTCAVTITALGGV